LNKSARFEKTNPNVDEEDEYLRVSNKVALGVAEEEEEEEEEASGSNFTGSNCSHRIR
jgi:hypothetical protein